jgi:hypothetical protein
MTRHVTRFALCAAIVSALLFLSATAFGTVLLTEDFEGAWTTGAPPGWTHEHGTGASEVDWVANSGDQRNNGAHGGIYNALEPLAKPADSV